MVTNFFQVNEGEHCWNVDLGSLGIGLTNGSLVTLQIQFNGVSWVVTGPIVSWYNC
jgi:pantoate kinase